MCAGLMQQARIDRCVYGAPDPKGGALGTLYGIHRDERLNHRFEVTAGVCEQECSTLLSDFFAQLRAQRGSKSGTEDSTP
jgi:tRNA(adenine34) deaminase